MKKHIIDIIMVFALVISKPHLVFGQDTVYKLDNKEKKVTIDSIGNKLKANYVFPEIANQMALKLEENFNNGNYRLIVNPSGFADQLTKDLQSISQDLHLEVVFDPNTINSQKKVVTPEEEAELEEKWVREQKRRNYGFKKVSILEGNIGYIDLRSFVHAYYAGETAVAAMNFLSDVDALIFDLRNNGGGSPTMIQLISSYLIYNTHLNNFYFRPSDEHTQSWTLPYVPGKRMPKIDVYILTSKSTFSAAEEFCYNLKNLQRATLVGETTGGGAHPGGYVNLTDKFRVWMPKGRAINPITNTNWEGVGVSPHIKVPASLALNKAHLIALETLSNNSENEESKEFYEWYIEALAINDNPITVKKSILESYVGTYGTRTISFHNGTLYYQRDLGFKYALIPLSQDQFMLKEKPNLRVEFVIENSKVVAMSRLYDNGDSETNVKE